MSLYHRQQLDNVKQKVGTRKKLNVVETNPGTQVVFQRSVGYDDITPPHT